MFYRIESAKDTVMEGDELIDEINLYLGEGEFVTEDIPVTADTPCRFVFGKLVVGETTSVYDPVLFDRALFSLKATMYRYKHRRFAFGNRSGYFQVTRTR